MLTLLLKRQAKARKAQAMKVEQESALNTPVMIATGARDVLEHKSWDEVQHILKTDLKYSRTLAGSQEKIPYKKELVKKYTPLVSKLLKSHESLDGLDVVWWFYQWQVDCGLLLSVHDAFKQAIFKGLTTPLSWNSNGQTAFLDVVFKYSHEAHKTKQSFNVQFLRDAVTDLIEGRLATNAPLKVKMFRLAGDLLLEAGNSKEALALFEMVMKIDPKKGGRKIKLKELREEFGYE
ncbi:phage terminase small subunit [Aliivibrio fischeri]|uniref:phage terminase small subunit n=1 Tax=Aliivibrio fischeri TaxID=668 RepID=UPI0012DA6F79|nr:phage terminase small subunit [Aliivibrio fischeri]MUK70162.1 hypothetical protein [Aliivibrio fischeri]MUK72696.1 hypothetical protein [Aliivibrio fischeri]